MACNARQQHGGCRKRNWLIKERWLLRGCNSWWIGIPGSMGRSARAPQELYNGVV